MATRPRDLTRIGEVLDRTLRSMGTPTSVAGVEVIFERWGEVVGEAMAERTRPVHIDGTTLVISCDEPAIATHVRFLETAIVDRVAVLARERRIERIQLRVAAGPRGPRPPRRGHPRS